MKLNPKQYAEGLFETINGKSEEEAQVVLDKFVSLLIANNQTSQLRKILDSFDSIWKQRNGIIEAEIKVAKKLSDDSRTILQNYVLEISKAKNVEMTEVIDETLLGGFIVKYDGSIVDNSLKTRIQDLKNNLNR